MNFRQFIQTELAATIIKAEEDARIIEQADKDIAELKSIIDGSEKTTSLNVTLYINKPKYAYMLTQKNVKLTIQFHIFLIRNYGTLTYLHIPEILIPVTLFY